MFHLLANSAFADVPPKTVGKCWTAKAPEGGVFSIAGDNVTVFASGYDGSVSAFDAASGMRVWSTELGGSVISNISFGGERVYAAARSADGTATLRSLSRETGVTIWSVEIPVAEHIFLGTDGEDVVYVNDQMTLGRHLAADGALLWQRSFTGAVLGTEPRFIDRRIFFGTSAKRVIAVDARTGAEELSFETSFTPTFVNVSPDKVIIWGGDRGNIVKMTNDAEDTSWRFKAGARVVDAVKLGSTLVAASHDNFVYGISAYNGDVIWKRRLPGRILSFTLMGGNTAVVTIVGESRAHLIDLSNGRVHDRFAIGGDNVMPLSPVRIGDNDIVIATNTVIVRYSIGGCGVFADKKTAGS